MKLHLLACLTALLLTALGAGAEGWFEEESADTFDYNNCDELVVEKAAVFSVEVAGDSGSRITGRIIQPRNSRLEVKHERRGRTVRIWAVERWSFFGWTTGEHRLQLRVPSNCNVRVDTDTGSIFVEDLRGDLTLRADTGSVTVRDCRGELQASTDTGNVEVADFRGRLALRSDTGSLTGAGVELNGDSTFRTDTGDIEFQLDNPRSELRYELATDTGRIEVGANRAREWLASGDGHILVRAESDTGSLQYR
jgi:hypothetical protein